MGEPLQEEDSTVLTHYLYLNLFLMFLVILNNSQKIIDTLQDLKKEKCFKIIYLINELETNFKAKNAKENFPPKIHNILSILKQSGLSLDESQQMFLLKLNQKYF